MNKGNVIVLIGFMYWSLTLWFPLQGGLGVTEAANTSPELVIEFWSVYTLAIVAFTFAYMMASIVGDKYAK